MIEVIGLILGALGVVGLPLGVWTYHKQKSDARKSAADHARFLENFAANRHNTADITFGGTTVRPGIGEAIWEGYAPTVTVWTKTPPKEGQ